MISRMALIIGAPDESIPGVNTDISNLKKYLMNPIGGFWAESEIKTLVSPSANAIKEQLELLKRKDYSLLFFAGHGYHSIQRESTILHINASETLDSLELRYGAAKHTLIIDCCRKPEDDLHLTKAAMESMTFDYRQRQLLDPAECRRYFCNAISNCDGGIVVMNSCSVGETAGENESAGGYYTSALLDAASEWAKEKLLSIDLAESFETHSTQQCHSAAAKQVGLLSGNRQTPRFESPRTEKKFPFAVVA